MSTVMMPGRTATWNPKESGQRGAGDVFSAAKEDHHGLADDRNLARNFSSHFGGEECQRIPGQQISAETKSHDKKQKQHAA